MILTVCVCLVVCVCVCVRKRDSACVRERTQVHGFTWTNDFLYFDPGSFNFSGKLVDRLAGVLVCVRVDIEPRVGEWH